MRPDDYTASFISNLVSDLFWNDEMDIKCSVAEMVTGKDDLSSLSEEEEAAVDDVYSDLCETMDKAARKAVSKWFRKYTGRDLVFDSDAREPGA